jgi:hypothetical protein
MNIIIAAILTLSMFVGQDHQPVQVDTRKATPATWAALQASLMDLNQEIGKARHVVNWRSRWIRYQFSDGKRGFTQGEVQKTIREAVDRWPVPGGLRTAFRVAQCESGYYPYSDNAYSSAAGVYQMLDSTWASWLTSFRAIHPHWKVRSSVYNARSNVLVAISHAHAQGWSAWSCY